jgi:hypothetical protein
MGRNDMEVYYMVVSTKFSHRKNYELRGPKPILSGIRPYTTGTLLKISSIT